MKYRDIKIEIEAEIFRFLSLHFAV